MTQVLLVEDDDLVAGAVAQVVALEGLSCVRVADLAAARRALAGQPPELIVLDRILPDGDGLSLLADLPDPRPLALVLTARDGVEDRVTGLEAGAEDYLVKPFAVEELRARLRVLVRRLSERGELVVADLRLDPPSRTAYRGERKLALTAREFELLMALAKARAQVVPRPVLLQGVFGFGPGTRTNVLDVYVNTVRRKLEAAGEPRLLHTIRGVGLVLAADAPGPPSAA